MIFFLELLHLLRGKGTEVIFLQPTDKERAEDAAIPTGDAAVIIHTQQNTLVIRHDANLLCVRV